MKKHSFILAVFIMLSNCVSLYMTSTSTIEDIEGKTTITNMLLDINDDPLYLVKYITPTGYRFFTFSVLYVGSSWRFMEQIKVKTDSGLRVLKDPNPSRRVSSGGYVSERVNAVISDEVKDEIMSTESLVIQVWAKPIVIPPEGIQAVKDFLSGKSPKSTTP